MRVGRGSQSFDPIADRYDETRGGEDRGRRFAKELLPLLDPSEPVLEVGVGTGLVAKGLQDLGCRVFGVDLSMAMLAQARRRIGPRVAAGDARRLPVADGSIDQALSVWVLHVARGAPEVLREAARILRPGGRYVVVPGMAGEPRDPVNSLIWDMIRKLDPEGIRRDDPERLRELAPAAGLRFVGAHEWPTYDYEETPATTLHKLESRSFSVLWDVSDEQWRTVVAPVIDAIRSLPSQDAPIRRKSTDQVVVLEKPALEDLTTAMLRP